MAAVSGPRAISKLAVTSVAASVGASSDPPMAALCGGSSMLTASEGPSAILPDVSGDNHGVGYAENDHVEQARRAEAVASRATRASELALEQLDGVGIHPTVTEVWQMAEYMILSPKRPLRNDHSLVARLVDHFANTSRGAYPIAPRTTTRSLVT